MTKDPVLILAAGASSRMRGRDKLMEDIDGQPLLRVMAQRALATGHPVSVALPVAPHARHSTLDGLDVAQIEVERAHLGMSESLKAGVSSLQGSARVLCVLADLPALSTADMAAVLNAPAAAPNACVWRGATQDGRAGHPVLLDASLFDAVMALDGDVGAREVIKLAGDRVQLVLLPGQAALLDLDTPEDWARWRAGAR